MTRINSNLKKKNDLTSVVHNSQQIYRLHDMYIQTVFYSEVVRQH